jgi:hypothetical protein
MGRSVLELRDYADEHLLYEIWMSATLTTRMRRHAARFHAGLSASDDPLAHELLDLTGRNADIESFALHVRNLLFFLYGKKAKQGDVVAASYFEDREDWSRNRPDRPKSLRRVNTRVPVEIVHLSVGRLKVRESDKRWPYEAMWRDLAAVIGVFLERVPEGRVSAEFREAGKALVASSSTNALQDTVSELDRMSLSARVGVTEAATSYSIMDDSSTGGTATMLPKPGPPGLGD